MIRIFLGNVGSGKSISVVREMVLDKDNPHALPYFTNIITKSKGTFSLPNVNTIKREHLFLEELQHVKKSGEEVYSLSFNEDYWMKQKQKTPAFNIVLDEAHTLIEARAFNSKQNRVMMNFFALIRKIANTPSEDATLTLISQLDSRVDVNARDMATEIRYHIGIYDKVCKKCGAYWTEHSEMPPFKKRKDCPVCDSKLLSKCNHAVIVHFFDSMKKYQDWKYNNDTTAILQTIKVSGLAEYFNYYDTNQVSELI